MSLLPSKLLVKLSQRLFEDVAEQAQFQQCLLQSQPFAPCILWRDRRPCPVPFALEPPLPWQPAFVDRLALGQKPGQHPLHAEGAFYCLDFSSVFAISPLLLLQPGLERVLDLCAAPGGKSVFAWVALQPLLLLANEVIGKRMGQLVGNLRRCRIQPAIALRFDTQILAEALAKAFPLVLVDAPCSGQSLLAKGGKAEGCFHPLTIRHNAKRQKRILANAAQMIAPQGHLIYTTCTYSLEENEQVIGWLLQRFPQFQPVSVPFLEAFQSHLAAFPCYRMFPQGGLGAGAFTVLLQNTETGGGRSIPPEWLHQPGLIEI